MSNTTTKNRNEKLALALELSPLTIKQICLLSEIDRSTIWRIVNNNDTKPHRRITKNLCQVLGAMPRELGLIYV